MKKAIITLYHPSKKNIENVFNILNQVDEVIVCDNSPESHKDYFNHPNIHYFSIQKNLGLSESFNRVLKDPKYKWNDNDYIIFFDQDSIIANNHIDILIEEFENLTSQKKIGCLGPIYYNNSSNKVEIPKIKVPLNEHSYSVKSIITSSMLTTYKNLKNINFWNENIFLDMADWDLCWQFIEKGYLCCLTDKVILNHTLGDGDKKILCFKIKTSNPIREYYQTRDCLYLLKEKYVPLKFKIRFIAMLTIRPILHLIFLENKRKRIYFIKQGIIDYFKKKHGEFKNEGLL